MAKGKRPSEPQGTPWVRWGGVIVGLALAGAIVWWVARPEPQTETGAGTPTAEPAAPQPLGAAAGPTVEAARIADVPPESLVSSGPDAPMGVDVSNDPRLGDPDAPVTIVELSDFQCPFCARFHQETFPALRRLYGDQVRWIFVNTPFPQHPHAEPAAIAAECAHLQGRFWEYADRLFSQQERLGEGAIESSAEAIGLNMPAFRACLSDPDVAAEVTADVAEGRRLGLEGTPTFFVNGRRILGAQPIGVFNEVIAPHFSR